LHGLAVAAIVGSGITGVRSVQPALVATPEIGAVAADGGPLGTERLGSPALLPLPCTCGTGGPEATRVVLDTAAPNVAAPSRPDAPLNVRTYVVEPGDSVRTIAGQFRVTNETIIWENDLTDPDILRVGQELHILPFSGLIHEVRPGDTVASIANGYDALIGDVISVNKLLEPYVIVVGQKLAVPGAYRPLPRKVVISPAGAPDIVQAPPGEADQVAALVSPLKRKFPVLGNTPQELFIASIGEAAVASADSSGVPASVTIAQAILETYWGSSRLAREANNYFGIKAQTRNGSAGAVRFDVWEVIGGRNVMQSQAFRAYTTIAESFVDHGLFFVENGRYAAAMAAKADPRQFARELNRAGYATDPSYAAKLITLMDRYDLYRYDDV
jgi:LysM repeat protein